MVCLSAEELKMPDNIPAGMVMMALPAFCWVMHFWAICGVDIVETLPMICPKLRLLFSIGKNIDTDDGNIEMMIIFSACFDFRKR